MQDYLARLTQERQNGMALAQDIKADVSGAPDRRELQRTRTVEYFDGSMKIHFHAEEEYIFPLVGTFSRELEEVVGLLRKHHTQLRSLVVQLRAAGGGHAENLLLRFAQVLEAHLRKEDWLFQRLHKEVPEEQLVACSGHIARYLEKNGHRIEGDSREVSEK